MDLEVAYGPAALVWHRRLPAYGAGHADFQAGDFCRCKEEPRPCGWPPHTHWEAIRHPGIHKCERARQEARVALGPWKTWRSACRRTASPWHSGSPSTAGASLRNLSAGTSARTAWWERESRMPRESGGIDGSSRRAWLVRYQNTGECTLRSVDENRESTAESQD